MNANFRKALYGLVPLIVAALTTYGVLTSNTAVLWGNVATLTIGFAYAASRATGNRFLDPEVRRGLYVLLPAVVALVGGYISIDIALWSSLVLAVLGAALAGLNVDPEEQGVVAIQGNVYGDGYLDKIQPKRAAGSPVHEPNGDDGE